MAVGTAELNFKFYLIFIHLKLKSHMWLIATISIVLYSGGERAIIYIFAISFDGLGGVYINYQEIF